MIDGNIIRKQRLGNNLTISDLANLCGVSDSYITKIERGNVPVSKTMRKKLLRAFQLDSGTELQFNEKDINFSNNKFNPVHRWYPYIEGFSQGFVDEILDKYNSNILVYDPFNGSGTTSLTCAYRGIRSIGSEINPFMRFISNTKVNTVYNILRFDKLVLLEKYIENFDNINLEEEINVKEYINSCYLDKDFFNIEILEEIAFIKKFILNIDDEDIRDIFMLALASICVESSNMIRSVDLRRKRKSEMERIPSDIKQRYLDQLDIILEDIREHKHYEIVPTKIITNNAKTESPNYNNMVDIIITSPPYVNGTNYFRNTKLELWILDFIKSEDCLKKLRTEAITAGINNVSSRIKIEYQFESVERYAELLDQESPDKRIPKLIRAYFSDMHQVFGNFYKLLKKDGRIYFDIGDSQYYGIHIPVFDIVIEIAELNGFKLEAKKVLRNRKSRNGMTLSQVLLIFKKTDRGV